MNRSRSLLFGILLLGLGGAAVAWLLAGHGAPEESGAGLLSSRGAEAPQAVLPDAEATAPEVLEAADDPAAVAAAAQAAAAAEAARADLTRRTIRGILLMEDGTALPEDVAVFAALQSPPPVLFTMRDVVGQQSEKSQALLGYGERAADDTDPLFKSSLVQPASDGRFEMPAPGCDVWLGVRAEGVCLAAPVHVPFDVTSEVEMLLVLGGSLVGRVTDSHGHGVAGALVRGATPFDPYGILDSASRMASVGTVQADDDGRFAFPQVPPGVELQVLARLDSDDPGDAPDDDEKEQASGTFTLTGLAEEQAAAAETEGRAELELQPAQVSVPALRPGERRSVELVLLPAGVVRGQVVRQDGTPVGGARVMLRRSSMLLKDLAMGDGGGLGDKELTGADGRFEFRSVASGQYEALLAEGGWRFARATNLHVEPGTVLEDLRLVAEEGLVVSGVVLDQAGQPLQGAMVRGFPPGSLMSFGSNFERELRPQASTDATGAFRLGGFDDGKVRLRANLGGYQTVQQDVLAGDSGVELRLNPCSSLSGIVVSLVDGEPVPTFTIGLTPSEGLFSASDMFGADAEAGFEKTVPPRRFAGREDGTFAVADVVAGTYDLRVTADGYGALLEKGVEVREGGRKGLVVMLEPECSVFGQIVDGRAGTPVLGATVKTTKGGGVAEMMESMLAPAPSVRTDAQGRFRLGGLPPGAVRLSIEHQRYRTLGVPDIVVQRGESHDLGVLRLSPGACVYGTVSDAHGPAASVRIMISNATGSTLKRATTDAQGDYRIEGLPPGTYNVMRMDMQFDIGGDSSVADMLADLSYESVTLAEDEERRVDLRTSTAGGVKLVGRVTDAAGPVAGAMMSLLPDSEGAKLAFATTDKDGRYEFKEVPSGRYGLQVIPMDSMGGQAAGQAGSPNFAAVELGALPEQRKDIALPGGVLNGVVVSADDGRTVPGVRVVLERTDEGIHEVSVVAAMGGRVGETLTDGAGAFRFRHLPGGTYAVVAGGQNFLGMGASGWAATRVEDLSVKENDSGFTVRIEVDPAAVVSGVLRDPGGKVLGGVGVWVLDAADTPRSVFSEVTSGDDGRYEVGDLATGAWTLAFMDGGHALTVKRGVVVREGETTLLDATLPPGVPVRVNLNGRPASSLAVSVSGPDGWLPTRLISLTDLASLPQASGTLAVGTYAPGNYHVQVLAGSELLLDASVTLVGGSGPKLLELPAP